MCSDQGDHIMEAKKMNFKNDRTSGRNKVVSLLVVALLMSLPFGVYQKETTGFQEAIEGKDFTINIANAVISVVKGGEWTLENVVVAVAAALMGIPKNFFLAMLPPAALLKAVDYLASAIVWALDAMGLLTADATVVAISQAVAVILTAIILFCIGETLAEVISIPLSGGASLVIVGPAQAIKWPVFLLSVAVMMALDVIAA